MNKREFMILKAKCTNIHTGKLNLFPLVMNENYDFIVAGYSALQGHGYVVPSKDKIIVITDKEYGNKNFEYHDKNYFLEEEPEVKDSFKLQKINNALKFMLQNDFSGNVEYFKKYIEWLIKFSKVNSDLKTKMEEVLNEI